MTKYALIRNSRCFLSHHGRKGQRWGVMYGPPYPLNRETIARSPYAKRIGANADVPFRLKKKSTSRAEDLRVINPHRSSKNYSHMNCTCCTAAYDMRRRGYDVIAEDPFPNGIGEKELEKFYNGMKVTPCYYYKDIKAIPKKTSARNSRALAKWMKKEITHQGSGARGMILIDTPEWSHAFNYENDRGHIRFLDAQSNREYTFKITDIAVDAAVIRLDDKEPNYQYLKQKGVVRNA